jgi:hypothetical protein
MIEFGDKFYFVDVKALQKATTYEEYDTTSSETKTIYDANGLIVSSEIINRTTPKTKVIDSVKYDLLRTFIEYIMDYDGVDDDALGIDRALNDTTLGYKVVFNTLINEGILKEK